MSKPELRRPLTPQEKRIWYATYAAAWMNEFSEAFRSGASFDRASGAPHIPDADRLEHAEQATTLADRAVQHLRNYRKSEKYRMP